MRCIGKVLEGPDARTGKHVRRSCLLRWRQGRTQRCNVWRLHRLDLSGLRLGCGFLCENDARWRRYIRGRRSIQIADANVDELRPAQEQRVDEYQDETERAHGKKADWLTGQLAGWQD